MCVCGELMFKAQKLCLTPMVKKCYELYFVWKVGGQEEDWVPHVCCSTCVKRLTGWHKGNRHMTSAIPIVWRISGKSKHTVKYPDLSSAIRPVPHSKDLPVSQPPAHVSVEDECEDESDKEMRKVEEYATFKGSTSSSEPHMITQEELNGLVRDLDLSKKAAELLASQWRLYIDFPKISLKVVLLHNGNTYPSVQFANSSKIK
ncbi:hypothetical protein PR048_023631 [Dryococelus australis]|uniref:Uncharacterized protein n=1 Tax=Dryococelus australis TaxID=614101 RepID=A0ABQ9GUM1_9NEOP|nr:hypothetical protein PR048_023631 [Dryococelus australis]